MQGRAAVTSRQLPWHSNSLERVAALAVTRDIRVAIEAKAQGAVGAATRAAKAEVEAMRQQLETEVAARNAVIEEVKGALTHERARSERLEGLLAEARRPWWRRWLG